MTDKKCPSCGGTDFVPYQFASYLATEFTPLVDTFACTKCGRVEFYARPDQLKGSIDKIKRDQELDAQIAEYDIKIQEKERELERLRAIANDENQTVKAVKEANERIFEVENEIRMLQAQKPCKKTGIFISR